MLISCADIPKRISKAEAIERIIKGLEVSEQEAEEIYAYDREVDQDETVGRLPPEKELISRKMCHTGTRARKEDKKPKKGPTTYDLDAKKHKRKPNATKEGVISELAEYMRENSGFEVENLQIPNATQKVSFQIGDKWYTFALTEHRTKPNWCK